MKTAHSPIVVAFVLASLAGSLSAAPARPTAPPSPEAGPAPAPAGGDAFGSPFGFVEDLLKKELTRRLGPASSYEIHLDRETTNLGEGRVGPVDVTGYDVQTANGLVLSRIDLHMPGTHISLDGKPAAEPIHAQFSAQLSPREVTRFVRKRAGTRLKELHLEFQRNSMKVRARPDVMGFKIDGAVEGRPVLRGNHEIDFRAKSASVFGVKLPKQAVEELEKRINPLVDLSGMKLPIQVERLAVRRDGILLDGMAEWDPASAPARERNGRRAAGKVRRDDGPRDDAPRARPDAAPDREPVRPAAPDRDAEFRRN